MDKENRQRMDLTLLLTAILLVAIGIIMVFSASYSYAMSNMGDGLFFLIRVLQWAAIGLVLMIVFSQINYQLWKKLANLLLLASLVLLVLVLTPVGTEINFAQRWIHIAGLSLMPTEVAKFSLIIFMAASLERKKNQMQTFDQGVIPYLLLSGAVFFLVYKQPDFSTGLVLVFLMIIMMFIGGIRISHFAFLSLAGLGAVGSFLAYVFLSGQGYKTRRLVAYLDPWADPSDAGLQTIQSLLAIGSGGLSGKGIGRSIQKHLHLPEPHNDFIFSIIAEELGFIGSAFVIVLFALFIWRCTRIAMNAPDVFGCLIASGVATLVGIQVIINIGVATSLLPVTGIPLPFISFGGNALVVLMALTGILLNISKRSVGAGG
ncbi:putative lipid II flippase FtsW [Anoxynatronum buryatiense]|uniref:Probable peptidoglycan glycosyltransferase FtsW n=1 Tax=Anoxynatronum buryatiense TaxID=489973 RepID=A0AA46AI54_9CLOT|nr:putative lipid II flippase FtsW [Anoxynatronum buryatiense]SMP46642.1 spore cortex peptidoglycan biosynthesis regulator SpoVE [Anoxynatronum buryatiense]